MRPVTLLRVAQSDHPPDDPIDVKEAAQILRVSKPTVYAAIRDGRLTAWERDFDRQVKLWLSRRQVERLARLRRHDPDAGDVGQSQAG